MEYLPPPVDLVTMPTDEYLSLVPKIERAGYTIKGNPVNCDLYDGSRCVGEVYDGSGGSEVYLEPSVLERIGMPLPKPTSMGEIPKGGREYKR